MNARFRKGDIVGLAGKVRHDESDGEVFIFVDVTGHHTVLMIRPEDMTLITPRIDVSERVRWSNGAEGIVKAADGDKLWVHMENGSYVTWPAKEVTIVAVVEPVVEPAAIEPPADGPEAPLDGKVGSEEVA